MSRDLRETLTADVARLLESNRALGERTQRLTRGLSLLARIAGLARSGEDRRATACAVLTGVTAGVGLGMNRGLLLVPSPGSADELEVLAATGPIDRAEADRVWRAIERDAPDLETLYEAGARALNDGSALDRRVHGARRPRGVAGAPLTLADGTRFTLDGPTLLEAPLGADAGWLAADNAFTGRTPDDETRLLFGLVASLAGPALASAARVEAALREASLDALTGLATRRTGDAILRELCDASLLDARPIALLLLDIDDFKRVNDTLGHPAGDAVLRAIGARVRTLLPPRARAFRYGGEEIAIVCDGLAEGDARALAETVRERLAAETIAVEPDSLSVTASIGLACARASTAEAFLRRADDALLAAKRTGKNRVVLAP